MNDENNFQDAGAAPSPQAQAPQAAPTPAAPAAEPAPYVRQRAQHRYQRKAQQDVFKRFFHFLTSCVFLRQINAAQPQLEYQAE